MAALTQFVPDFAAYQPAFIALTVLCLAVLVQAMLAGVLGLAKGGEVPGMPLSGSHQDFSFRVLRTYSNSVENLPAFAIIVLLAVLAGASATLVNWLAAIHVLLRLAFWGLYYSGLGPISGGPRSIAYVSAWLVNLILALATLLAFF